MALEHGGLSERIVIVIGPSQVVEAALPKSETASDKDRCH